MCLPGGGLTQRKDWMFFTCSLHIQPACPIQVWGTSSLIVLRAFYIVSWIFPMMLLKSQKPEIWRQCEDSTCVEVDKTKCFNEALQTVVSPGSGRWQILLSFIVNIVWECPFYAMSRNDLNPYVIRQLCVLHLPSSKALFPYPDYEAQSLKLNVKQCFYN